MTSLADLVRPRSGAALSLIAYLKSTAEEAEALPSYFPARLRDGARDWFTVVRQKVRVRDTGLERVRSNQQQESAVRPIFRLMFGVLNTERDRHSHR